MHKQQFVCVYVRVVWRDVVRACMCGKCPRYLPINSRRATNGNSAYVRAGEFFMRILFALRWVPPPQYLSCRDVIANRNQWIGSWGTFTSRTSRFVRMQQQRMWTSYCSFGKQLLEKTTKVVVSIIEDQIDSVEPSRIEVEPIVLIVTLDRKALEHSFNHPKLTGQVLVMKDCNTLTTCIPFLQVTCISFSTPPNYPPHEILLWCHIAHNGKVLHNTKELESHLPLTVLVLWTIP